MRMLLAIVVLLVLGLLAQDTFDSAIGAWVAFGAVIALVAMKFFGWIGVWPADWPDFGGGD
jgi:hypothetical protein